MPPVLTALDLAADPDAWRDAGFTVDGDEVRVDGVAIRFVATDARRGLVGWELDGQPAPPSTAPHPNGTTEIEHVVLMTPNLEATTAELADQGFEGRRTRDAGKAVTQVFYRMGRPILEVVGPVASPHPYLWGIAFTAADLDETCEYLGAARVGQPKPAVQPARRIATVRAEANLGTAVAFMSPAATVEPR